MAESKLHLKIITPHEIKVDEDADMVIMRCVDGDMGVLPRHEPRTEVLADGILRLHNEGQERRIAIFGGLAEIHDDIVTILTSDAEWPEDIDRSIAESERDFAERSLQENADDLEIQSMQVRLRRSLVRIEVSSYPLVSGSKKET